MFDDCSFSYFDILLQYKVFSSVIKDKSISTIIDLWPFSHIIRLIYYMLTTTNIMFKTATKCNVEQCQHSRTNYQIKCNVVR